MTPAEREPHAGERVSILRQLINDLVNLLEDRVQRGVREPDYPERSVRRWIDIYLDELSRHNCGENKNRLVKQLRADLREAQLGNAELAAERDRLREALGGMLNHYVRLAGSGGGDTS